MSISGIGEKYYQNNVTTMKSTKNVNSTEEFALEKNKRNAGIVGSGRNGIVGLSPSQWVNCFLEMLEVVPEKFHPS